MALATWSEAEMIERAGVKWISPSQTQSMPQASAWSASLEDVPERRGLGGPVAQLLDEDPEVHGVILARRAGAVKPPTSAVAGPGIG